MKTIFISLLFIFLNIICSNSIIAALTEEEKIERNTNELMATNEKAPVAVYGEWTVFKTIQDNKTYCYAMNIPQSKQSNFYNRGEPLFIIVKEINNKNVEIVLSVGYIINDEIGSVELEVDNNKFPLFNYQDRAWSYSIEDDLNILKLFNNNLLFSISGRSFDNKYSIDVYSLLGFKEAYRYVIEMCK